MVYEDGKLKCDFCGKEIKKWGYYFEIEINYTINVTYDDVKEEWEKNEKFRKFWSERGLTPIDLFNEFKYGGKTLTLDICEKCFEEKLSNLAKIFKMVNML